MTYLYHGTVTSGITTLEPRKRYTPQGVDLKAIYATPLPAFAAAHAFPWSTDEGVDLDIVEGKVVLVVTESFKERLNVKIYMYKVSAENFEQTKDELTGYTYHTTVATPVISVEEFNDVQSAILHFGGEVRIK